MRAIGEIDERLRVDGLQEAAGSTMSIWAVVNRRGSGTNSVWLARLARGREGWSGETGQLRYRDGSEI